MYCKFKDIVSYATVLSPNEIVCKIPGMHDGGQSVVLYISSNGYDWYDVGIPFIYYNMPQVYYLDPPTGPALGGTIVTVKGIDIINNTYYPGQHQCKFGTQIVTATLSTDNDNTLTCISPPKLANSSSSVSLDVSIDGGIEFSNDSVRFCIMMILFDGVESNKIWSNVWWYTIMDSWNRFADL